MTTTDSTITVKKILRGGVVTTFTDEDKPKFHLSIGNASVNTIVTADVTYKNSTAGTPATPASGEALAVAAVPGVDGHVTFTSVPVAPGRNTIKLFYSTATDLDENENVLTKIGQTSVNRIVSKAIATML